eukprot:scaffold24254_cov240-Cylindrotheca_fusiformis.AAC.1
MIHTGNADNAVPTIKLAFYFCRGNLDFKSEGGCNLSKNRIIGCPCCDTFKLLETAAGTKSNAVVGVGEIEFPGKHPIKTSNG